MRSGGSAPKPPMYVPPAPYVDPGPYIAPPDPNKTIPNVLTPTEAMTGASGVESMLPPWMQITQDPMNPHGVQQYGNQWYQQNVAPQIASDQAQLFANGQGYGSYAGGQIGQEQAMGKLQQQQAGLNYSQQLFNNQLAGRQSYFGNDVGLVVGQNAQDVQRGTSIAGMQLQESGNHNNYNLGSAGMHNQYDLGASGQQNGFNLDNYKNALNAWQIGQQQKSQQAFGLGSLGLGAGQLLGKYGGGLFGGGGGGGGGAGNMFGGGGGGGGGTFGSAYGFGGTIGNYGLNAIGDFSPGGTGIGGSFA